MKVDDQEVIFVEFFLGKLVFLTPKMINDGIVDRN